MKIYHGSYKKIENFNEAPIWCSDLFETANNYILCQSEGKEGSFGYMYELEIEESDIVFVEDFSAVDCGEILSKINADIISAESETGDRIFLIRNALKVNFKEI